MLSEAAARERFSSLPRAAFRSIYVIFLRERHKTRCNIYDGLSFLLLSRTKAGVIFVIFCKNEEI